MKITRRGALGAFKGLAAAAALLATSAPLMAEPEVTIRYSPWLSANSAIHTGLLRPWIEEVERVTEGRVTVEFLPKAVGKPAEQFDVVRDGLADMGVILPGYTPGRFPLLEMGELPFLSEDAAVIAPAFYRAYEQHIAPLDPLKGTHLLTIFSTTPSQLVTNKPIGDSVEDLQGLKLRAPTVTSIEVINALGAVPVQKSVTEMYEMASTGIVDGTFFSRSAVRDWNLAGLLSHMTQVPGGFGQPVMAFLLNEDVWNRISEQDRAAIMEISGEELARKAGANYAASDADAVAEITEGGLKIEDASPAFVEAVKTQLAPVEADWIARAKAEGLEDPAAALSSFREDMAKSGS